MSVASMPPRQLCSRMLRPLLGAASRGRTNRERTNRERTNQKMANRQKTEQALLELVSIDSVARLRAGAEHFDRDLDQAYLAELAYREDLAPLAYRTLSQANAGTVQGPTLQRLEYMYGLTCRRNALAYLQLAQVLQGLDAEGIDPLVLKGAALATQVYDDPGLRPFADLDILVRNRDLQPAHQVLVDLGYRFNYKGQAIAAPSEADLRYRSARQYFHQDPNYLSIDLYWQLGRYPYLVETDYQGLWDRASRVELGGVPALVPSPEDEILHLALDFTLGVWYGRPELKPLRDIAEIAAKREVNWDTLGSRVRRSALDSSLYYSCRLSRELLGADIPSSLFGAIHSEAGWCRNWVVKRLAKRIFGSGHPIEYLLLALLMGLSGPEKFGAKANWIGRFLVPPKSLWGSLPRTLKRVLAAKLA